MRALRPIESVELPLSGATVVVLAQAPLDQSPRMVAQAWALAEAGASVRFVAFGNAEDFPLRHPRIAVHAVPGPGRDTSAGSRRWPLLAGAGRMLATARRLGATLKAAAQDADLILTQVPPAIPGAWLAAWRKIPLVLDWHNLSGPMAALKLGARHPVVRLLDVIEGRLGPKALLHFAVTGALAAHLERRLVRPVLVLPDRPLVLGPHAAAPAQSHGEALSWRTLVSSTSWTLDEAMEMLLDAASLVRIPPGMGLRLIVTGKGPLRAAFEARAAALQRPELRIETAWLSPGAYAARLASADAGISLHRSASGLDFPMKLIDMEAAGLPVLALDYGPALRDGLAGLAGARTFADAAGLAACLESLLVEGAPPHGSPRAPDWATLWARVALPALEAILR